jgi:hypothetical protein
LLSSGLEAHGRTVSPTSDLAQRAVVSASSSST